ncbi:hypothetical protein [Shigella sonnei]|uniref:hypothetical protein n=1 Tax=Shigella sonnei TaxID=624 RepID=UPI000662D9C8|nr:hypothetical protein [Shigella sonnei]CSI98710.1 Uncharacterised protein [Shigella sonnei]
MKILNSNLITNISSTIRNHLLTSSKNIKTHPSPNIDVTSHRRLFQKDGIGLSQTGKATQLVIMSHGGWKEISHPQTLFTRQKGDGWTVVPKNLRLDFYTKDNDFTKGLYAPLKRAERDSDADTAKRDVLPRKNRKDASGSFSALCIAMHESEW